MIDLREKKLSHIPDLIIKLYVFKTFYANYFPYDGKMVPGLAIAMKRTTTIWVYFSHNFVYIYEPCKNHRIILQQIEKSHVVTT